MGTIKQDRKDLEMMLDGIDPISDRKSKPASASAVDNQSGMNMMEQKIFDFDYDTVKKSIRKKARKTVANIVKHVLNESMSNDVYVADKMEQDIDTLTELYMQVETNTLMQKSLVESVSRGNTMPRMYEVFGQLTDRIRDINKQIISTEQTIRKTYQDIKFEIRDKEAEEGETKAQKYLPESSESSLVVTSTRQLIEMAKRKHHENKILEISENEYTEEK